MAAPLLACAAAALPAAAAAAHAGALLYGPTERAWTTMRAAAVAVAGIACNAALPQDLTWPGGRGRGRRPVLATARAGTPAAAGEGRTGRPGLPAWWTCCAGCARSRRAARPGRAGERRRSAARSRAVARVTSGPPAGGVHRASISTTMMPLIMPGCASAAKRRRGRAGEAGQMICIYAAAAATGDALAAALCAAHRRASAVRNDSEP